MSTTEVLDEAEIIRQAQRRLMAQRAQAGLDVTTGEGAAGARPPRPDVRQRAGDVPAALTHAIGPVAQPGQHTCMAKIDGKRCFAAIEFPGICAGCSMREQQRERAEAIAECVAKNIPAMYLEATWADLPTLKNMAGDGPRLALPPVRLAGIRKGLECERRTVLIGPAGSGKSTIAAAFIHEAIDRGAARARFIEAILLEDTDEGHQIYELALWADDLVLDDLGAELHGAPAEGGVAAMRIKMVDKLLTLRFSRNRRTVVTTPHDKDKLAKIYGAGIARRVFDGAAVVRIGAA